MRQFHFIADDLGMPRDYSRDRYGIDPPGTGTDKWLGLYVDEGVGQIEGLLYAHAEFKRRYPEKGDA